MMMSTQSCNCKCKWFDLKLQLMFKHTFKQTYGEKRIHKKPTRYTYIINIIMIITQTGLKLKKSEKEF